MTPFSYPLPESDPSSGFEGLSDEAKTALTNIGNEPSQASQLLGPDSQNNLIGPESINSAKEELEDSLRAWNEYEGRPSLGNFNIPATYNELIQGSPNLLPTALSLYEAKQALIASGELTPEGLNVGETMQLALIPWQEMLRNLPNLDAWLPEFRRNQGIASDDYFNNELLNAIKSEHPFYRYPDNPSRLLTSTEYLDIKTQDDGRWGVMLVQTSNEAGLKSLIGQSPDQMTNNGNANLKLAEFNVDNMGIFEWIALTLQKDPSLLSSQDYSWLLANRLEVDGQSRVPGGGWDDGRVVSGLYWSGDRGDDARPRLAVM